MCECVCCMFCFCLDRSPLSSTCKLWQSIHTQEIPEIKLSSHYKDVNECIYVCVGMLSSIPTFCKNVPIPKKGNIWHTCFNQYQHLAKMSKTWRKHLAYLHVAVGWFPLNPHGWGLIILGEFAAICRTQEVLTKRNAE